MPRVDTAVFRWITALLEDPETILAGYQHAQRLQKERNQEAKLYVDSARRVLEEIRERIIEIKKLRSVIRDIGSLTFPQRRRLIKLLNLRFEFGMQDYRCYIDIIQNTKEHTNGTRH